MLTVSSQFMKSYFLSAIDFTLTNEPVITSTLVSAETAKLLATPGKK